MSIRPYIFHVTNMPQNMPLLLILNLVGYVVGTQLSGCSGPPSNNTDVASLIASNYNGAQGTSTVMLQTSPEGFPFRVVCLSSSGIRNQYRFVSIVAYYTINGGAPQYGQFEFECVNTVWSATSTFLGNILYNRQPLMANSSAIRATIRTNCSYCLNGQNPQQFPPRSTDTVNHCSGELQPNGVHACDTFSSCMQAVADRVLNPHCAT